jgi:hypothetical protein
MSKYIRKQICACDIRIHYMFKLVYSSLTCLMSIKVCIYIQYSVVQFALPAICFHIGCRKLFQYQLKSDHLTNY